MMSMSMINCLITALNKTRLSKCQNMNKNKSVHKCIYDMQKIHIEEYVDGNFIWVSLCTDLLRQLFFVDIHSGNRVFRGEWKFYFGFIMY